MIEGIPISDNTRPGQGALVKPSRIREMTRRIEDLEASRLDSGRTKDSLDIRRRVIVLKPVVTSGQSMQVRQIRYRDTPPIPCPGADVACALELHGVVFTAYPEAPALVEDFEDGALEADLNGDLIETERLDSETKVYTAWRESNTWRLEKPASDATEPEYVVILATNALGGTAPTSGAPGAGIATLEDTELRVQKIRLDTKAAAYVAKGEPMDAAVYPNCPKEGYHQYIGQNRNVIDHPDAMYFRMEKVFGLWTVDQKPLLETGATPAGAAGACTSIIT